MSQSAERVVRRLIVLRANRFVETDDRLIEILFRDVGTALLEMSLGTTRIQLEGRIQIRHGSR